LPPITARREVFTETDFAYTPFTSWAAAGYAPEKLSQRNQALWQRRKMMEETGGNPCDLRDMVAAWRGRGDEAAA
jgi:hypothetical protein